MKFSLSVCEFNPLHNGHLKLISEMKRSGDAVIIIMGGNFCQRGEAAILDKYTRARHAILAGADIVFELPAVFATSPAEIFAKGAIKLLNEIEGEKTLFFGAESGDRSAFLTTADIMTKESKEFKRVLKDYLSTGIPFAEAREKALVETEEVDLSLLKTPNSVLGVEYCKAIKFFRSDMDIHPILREDNYNDESLSGECCSALAVRSAIEGGKKKKVKKYLPSFVYEDLPDTLPDVGELTVYAAIRSSSKDLKEITDCSEGLENRIKVLARDCKDLKTLIDRLETRRYTRRRIARILTNNLLGITRDFSDKCLRSDLYLKVLAVNEDRKDLLSLKSGRAPFLTRKSDVDGLGGIAKECFLKDVFASDVFSLVTGKRYNEYEMKTIKS
ncbi:MAG: nucleotidyltransferase family protein [Clostridia bacterium]|nr:nucleotidyltransferase family protein [Clostridia bacterium]